MILLGLSQYKQNLTLKTIINNALQQCAFISKSQKHY